jgi:hypothetical protein
LSGNRDEAAESRKTLACVEPQRDVLFAQKMMGTIKEKSVLNYLKGVKQL